MSVSDDLDELARNDRELAQTYRTMAEVAWPPRRGALKRAAKDVEERADRYVTKAEWFRRNTNARVSHGACGGER